VQSFSAIAPALFLFSNSSLIKARRGLVVVNEVESELNEEQFTLLK
jgi:hypothetical protein